LYPSSGCAFGRSVERRYSEFTNFPDEVNVMPLVLLRLRPSSLWLSGAVPESEPTILDQGHILMEVMAQCCILSLILCNVICMSGQSLCYQCLCCYLGCPLKVGNNGRGILLTGVYVRVGDWGLLPALEFPCVACGACVP
jgi:hypothetical protein